MKIWLLPALAACSMITPAPGAAQSSREYFTARISQQEAPQQLSRSEREFYSALFTAIERENWDEVEQRLLQNENGLLHDVARAEYYLAANSPRVEAPQIDAWMRSGRDLPQAAQLDRLAQRRGASEPYSLPQQRALISQRAEPRRVRPSTTNDGTMPESTSAAILQRISNDDPHGAAQLLAEIDPSLSSDARAEWRQRVSWSFFIENMDQQALAMALTVADGTGPWVAEGEWVAGLASWRMGDCETALDAFQRAAYPAINPELRSASLYWASRSALRCRQPVLSNRLLLDAAGADQTLYGMIAAEQLGKALPERVERADFSDEDWRNLRNIRNVQVAVALAEIGRDGLSSQVLLHQSRIGEPSQFASLSRLARSLGFAQTQLAMAYNAPQSAMADPASFYPAPKIQPTDGWQIDPALAFAHILQESAFRPNVVSPADAQGLMQITPITVRQHSNCIGRPTSAIDVFDPATNLALGQCNLQMLRDDSATAGRLPKMMAAYNAGMTPVRRWESEVVDQDDPLLYMEAIPYWETREYVSVVMRNYWMYERQARAISPSRIALASNEWPVLTNGLTNPSTGSGRVFLSTGGN